MGAYIFNDLHLRDEDVEEFVRLAMEPYTRDGSVSDWEFAMRDLSRYIAERIVHNTPEVVAGNGGDTGS
jgi:hypothetical protein